MWCRGFWEGARADCDLYRPQLGTTVGVDVGVDGSVEEST